MIVPAEFGRSSARFKKLWAELRAQQLPCALCGGDINYDIRSGPWSFSVDHRLPRKHFPQHAEEEWNLQAAHLICNQRKSANAGFRPEGADKIFKLGTRTGSWRL